jgi:hypothetical protein
MGCDRSAREIYLKLLAVAEPARLNPAQMAEVLDKFKSYGQSRRP